MSKKKKNCCGLEMKNMLVFQGPCEEDCGYCMSKNNWKMFGFHIVRIGLEMYEEIANRGAFRSGTWLYFSDPTSCCPLYQVRVDVKQFVPSKSQKKVLRKVNALGVVVEVKDAENSKEKYDLYVKYQNEVHSGQNNSESMFISCFTKSPVANSLKHIEFRTKEGKLIGYSVVEILSSQLTSSYFVWDKMSPFWKKLNLGVYSALKEIEICQKMGLRYWFPDGYVHNNSKMNYKVLFFYIVFYKVLKKKKASYKPMEILCSCFKWHKLEDQIFDGAQMRNCGCVSQEKNDSLLKITLFQIDRIIYRYQHCQSAILAKNSLRDGLDLLGEKFVKNESVIILDRDTTLLGQGIVFVISFIFYFLTLASPYIFATSTKRYNCVNIEECTNCSRLKVSSFFLV